jgi:hypothetical protein
LDKRLTSQQLVMASSGALVTGTVMLSHDNRLGFALLALAAACALTAFLRWAGD